MANVNTSFKKFIKDITPGDYYYDTVFPSRLTEARTDLAQAFPSTSDVTFVQAKYLGSASKHTMITPVNDLDILAEFSFDVNAQWKYNSDSFAFITRIRNAYNGYRTQVVGTRGQAVRVFYQKYGHVDIAPVVRVNSTTYKLPDGKGGWIYTSPEVANDWFFTKHKQLDYRLKDLVKLAKKWNNEHSSRLSSFHLETMVAAMFSSLGTYQDLNLRDFFQYAPSWLDVNDPGGQSGVLSTYLTYNARNDTIRSLQAAYSIAVEARECEQNNDHATAIAKWRRILGADFPSL